MLFHRRYWCGLVTAAVVLAATLVSAQDKFARTDSRNQYVHRIQLYDASKKLIDPSDPNAPPYSPMATCGKCHDYKAIAHGWHFNAFENSVPAGRPGEPWIWTDRRSGTQIPLSYRGWVGTFKPGDIGMSRWEFITTFGHHYPGGGPGEAGAEEDVPGAEARWNLSGALAIDCMICHADNRSYDPETYAKQIGKHNFAWAPTAAIGLGYVDGDVSRLPKDFDPAKPPAPEAGKPALPKVTYYLNKFNPDKEVFFDVVRRPSTNNCYYCHTARPVGEGIAPDWDHDTDVHVKAGLSCVACHRNGIEHHTIRGFEGEARPEKVDVSTLTCRGCHIGDHEPTSLADFGGRLGSPKPHHGGIPPLHFESLSCTVCHSGALPDMSAGQVQTSLAHELGLPSQTRDAGDQPIIVAPVYLRNEAGVIEPRRMVWPAYWARMQGEKITPIEPEAAYAVVRGSLRIRNDFMREVGKVTLSAADKAKLLGEERAKLRESELTEEEKLKLARATIEKAAGEFPDKISKALAAFAKDKNTGDGVPVYISAGKLYHLGDDGKLVIAEGHPAAAPYSWPLAHDVRPARQALGAGGCTDCHAADSPFVYGTVAAAGPAPDATPITMRMATLQGLDEDLWQAWTLSFQGRDAFKIMAMIVLALLTLVLILYGLRALGGFGAWLNRPRT